MTNCWYWTGSYYDTGYGQVWSKALQRGMRAHRMVYEYLVGPIPKGLQLDHLCRVRSCVNPEHMNPVTGRDNLFAPGALTIAKANATKTRCHKGHVFDVGNTFLYEGHRHCRTCRIEWKRERRKRCRNSALGYNPDQAAADPWVQGKL